MTDGNTDMQAKLAEMKANGGNPVAADSTQSEDEVLADTVTLAPEVADNVDLKKGQFCLSCANMQDNLKLALKAGKLIDLPYITSLPDEIAELKKFSEHLGGQVVLSEGQ